MKYTCYICGGEIGEKQAFSVHKYGNGEAKYWHYRCYLQQKKEYLPVTRDVVLNLYGEYKNLPVQAMKPWKVELLAVLENCVRSYEQ